MRDRQDGAHAVHQHAARGGGGGGVLAVQPRLGRLHVPVRKLVPEEVVQAAAGRAKVHALLCVRDLIHSLRSAETLAQSFAGLVDTALGMLSTIVKSERR